MQQALRPTAPNGAPCRSYRPATMQFSRSKVVAFSQGPGGKPIREFREDTGEISVPGEDNKQQSQANATLYADQIAMVSSSSRRKPASSAYYLFTACWVCGCNRGSVRPCSSAISRAMQAKKKDNMSREMKQRLRQEYYGLGGAENTVSALQSTAAVLVRLGASSRVQMETHLHWGLLCRCQPEFSSGCGRLVAACRAIY